MKNFPEYDLNEFILQMSVAGLVLANLTSISVNPF